MGAAISSVRLVAALALVTCLGWIGTLDAGAATPSACDVIGPAVRGRRLGAASAPRSTLGNFGRECSIRYSGGLTLHVNVSTGGSEEFDSRRDELNPRRVEVIDGYADGGFIEWVHDGLTFVGRRGDQIVSVQATGHDETLGFDDRTPRSDDPAGRPSGSQVGSTVWLVTTAEFAAMDLGAEAKKVDLTGLWITADIDGCAPKSNLVVRVIDIVQTGSSLKATKRTGDRCLEDGAADFDIESVNNGKGTGTSAARVGAGASSRIERNDVELTAESATSIRLVGTAGGLSYAREYSRLSWPGLETRPPPVPSLLGIPTPAQALTPKNILLGSVTALVLFALVAFPTLLFNSTLEANLDRYRAWGSKLRRPKSSENSTATSRRWRGVVIYACIASFLYGLIQPRWGFNTGTVVNTVGFFGSIVIATVVSIGTLKLYLSIRYRDGTGRPLVAFSTLIIAGCCALVSHAVGFLPGYFLGVIAAFQPNRSPDRHDRAQVAMIGSSAMLALAITAWILLPVLQRYGAAGNSLSSIPAAVSGGVFVGAVELLTIGLIPLTFLPGATLRAHNRTVWLGLWGCGSFLFSLALLRPGLVSGESRNIPATLALVGVFDFVCLGLWAAARRHHPDSFEADAIPAAVSEVDVRN